MRSRLATIGLCLAASAAAAAKSPKSPKPPASSPDLSARYPIPEHAPVDAVLLPEDLFRFDYHAPALAQAIARAGAAIWVAVPGKVDVAATRQLLREAGVDPWTLDGVKVVALPHDNIWLRDYGPIPLLETTPTGPRLRFADFRYDDASPRSDDLPKSLGAHLGIPVDGFAVFIDGGNLLVAGDLCITSGPVEGGAGELTPGPEALKAQYGAALGCRAVVVLKDPPHAHLDMWAKVVDDQTILVNDLTPATLAVAKAQGRLAEARLLKAALDRMATELAWHLAVQRLPMPLPYRGVFRTYTNAILVNGRAIVPSFRRVGRNYDDYPDAALASRYEAEAMATYAAFGFTPELLNADGMIFNGGAFRCVTVALPKIFPHPSARKGI